MDPIDETTRNSVVDSLIDELETACSIVTELDGETYAQRVAGESSIGAHIRHNLEFVNELLNGIALRRVDYNARARDIRIEIDRAYAIEHLSFACERLRSLTLGLLACLVLVRSEVDEDAWYTSSVSREIEFLHSHTVHHYAIVAHQMAEAGVATDAGFGVAPSTSRFRKASEARRDSYAASY